VDVIPLNDAPEVDQGANSVVVLNSLQVDDIDLRASDRMHVLLTTSVPNTTFELPQLDSSVTLVASQMISGNSPVVSLEGPLAGI